MPGFPRHVSANKGVGVEPDRVVSLGVVGGCGGIGASRFAAVLAAVAAERASRCLLLDLEPLNGGLDAIIGAERMPGARWSGLHLAGGTLDSESLLSGLPHWGAVAVLACDGGEPPSAPAVGQVLDSLKSVAPVVVDLGRGPSPGRVAAAQRVSMLVLLTGCDLAALSASSRLLAQLAPATTAHRVFVIVRGSRLAASRSSGVLGLTPAARLPAHARRDGAAMNPRALPHAMRTVASGLLDGLLIPRVTRPPSGVRPRSGHRSTFAVTSTRSTTHHVGSGWVPGVDLASGSVGSSR